MKRFALLLLVAASLAGCTTLDRNEIASLRGRGLAPRVVEKLDRGLPLAPDDVLDLHRKRVPDPWVIRQLDDHGVDSLVTRSDVTRLRKGGVRPGVMDALIKASDRFEGRYRYSDYAAWSGYDPYDPWDFYGPYPYGYGFGTGYGATLVVPINGHHHRYHGGRGHHRR